MSLETALNDEMKRVKSYFEATGDLKWLVKHAEIGISKERIGVDNPPMLPTIDDLIYTLSNLTIPEKDPQIEIHEKVAEALVSYYGEFEGTEDAFKAMRGKGLAEVYVDELIPAGKELDQIQRLLGSALTDKELVSLISNVLTYAYFDLLVDYILRYPILLFVSEEDLLKTAEILRYSALKPGGVRLNELIKALEISKASLIRKYNTVVFYDKHYNKFKSVLPAIDKKEIKNFKKKGPVAIRNIDLQLKFYRELKKQLNEFMNVKNPKLRQDRAQKYGKIFHENPIVQDKDAPASFDNIKTFIGSSPFFRQAKDEFKIKYLDETWSPVPGKPYLSRAKMEEHYIPEVSNYSSLIEENFKESVSRDFGTFLDSSVEEYKELVKRTLPENKQHLVDDLLKRYSEWMASLDFSDEKYEAPIFQSFVRQLDAKISEDIEFFAGREGAVEFRAYMCAMFVNLFSPIFASTTKEASNVDYSVANRASYQLADQTLSETIGKPVFNSLVELANEEAADKEENSIGENPFIDKVVSDFERLKKDTAKLEALGLTEMSKAQPDDPEVFYSEEPAPGGLKKQYDIYGTRLGEPAEKLFKTKSKEEIQEILGDISIEALYQYIGTAITTPLFDSWLKMQVNKRLKAVKDKNISQKALRDKVTTQLTKFFNDNYSLVRTETRNPNKVVQTSLAGQVQGLHKVISENPKWDKSFFGSVMSGIYDKSYYFVQRKAGAEAIKEILKANKEVGDNEWDNPNNPRPRNFKELAHIVRAFADPIPGVSDSRGKFHKNKEQKIRNPGELFKKEDQVWTTGGYLKGIQTPDYQIRRVLSKFGYELSPENPRASIAIIKDAIDQRRKTILEINKDYEPEIRGYDVYKEESPSKHPYLETWKEPILDENGNAIVDPETGEPKMQWSRSYNETGIGYSKRDAMDLIRGLSGQIISANKRLELISKLQNLNGKDKKIFSDPIVFSEFFKNSYSNFFEAGKLEEVTDKILNNESGKAEEIVLEEKPADGGSKEVVMDEASSAPGLDNFLDMFKLFEKKMGSLPNLLDFRNIDHKNALKEIKLMIEQLKASAGSFSGLRGKDAEELSRALFVLSDKEKYIDDKLNDLFVFENQSKSQKIFDENLKLADKVDAWVSNISNALEQRGRTEHAQTVRDIGEYTINNHLKSKNIEDLIDIKKMPLFEEAFKNLILREIPRMNADQLYSNYNSMTDGIRQFTGAQEDIGAPGLEQAEEHGFDHTVNIYKDDEQNADDRYHLL